MAIQLETKQVTNSYEESQTERTKEILIRTPLDGEPEIVITREIVTYHDGVLFSKNTSRIFRITVEDLVAIGKLGIMAEVASVIDTIGATK